MSEMYYKCDTCAYRWECVGNCTGYVPDEDEQEERDIWDELAADVARDDAVGYGD